MSLFKFKQFDVDQTGCAMKINTDGVLLGAIAAHQSPDRILDIGTGTGVIALMLAQRFPDALVEAVEIDEQASRTAVRNFEQSKFATRLSCHHVAIAGFHSSGKFDLIVSNPPFFVNDMKNEEVRKGIARHADEVFFEELVNKVAQLLSKQGRCWLILPLKQAAEVCALAHHHGLYPNERINLCSDESKAPFRQIICLSRSPEAVIEKNLFIYEAPKVHTPMYRQILKDFFLAF